MCSMDVRFVFVIRIAWNTSVKQIVGFTGGCRHQTQSSYRHGAGGRLAFL